MERRENCEILKGLLTCKAVERLLGRSDQTLAAWRRDHGMPYVLIESEARPMIRYRAHKVLAWAKEQDRELVQSEADKYPIEEQPVEFQTHRTVKRTRRTFPTSLYSAVR